MKSRVRVFSVLGVGALFLLLSSSTVIACSCVSEPTVDIVADTTPNIAIFRVESVREATKEKGLRSPGATLVVENVFKGKLTPGEKFTFSNEGICVLAFEETSVGKIYLLYLNERPVLGGKWAAGLCTRSGRLESTSDDVLYLEKRAQVRGKTRLSGRVSQQIETGGEPRDWYYKSLAGIPLRIRGNGTDVTLKTDDNGAYEIYDLRPGKYDIFSPEITGFTKDLWDGPAKPISVQIQRKKHTELNIFYEIDSSLSGKLVDDQGLPIAGTCLELVPTSHTLLPYVTPRACTDIKGEFQIANILSGTYILVGNKENKITSRDPFPTVYYPDKEGVSEADRFTLSPGVHFTGLVMRAPSFAEVINVSGSVRFSDGKPAAKADVYFFAGVSEKAEIKARYSYASRAETDENGNFRIRVTRGEKGVLVGSFEAYTGEYKNCPQIKKIIDEGGFGSEKIDTPAVRIDTSSEIGGIELEYPFTACAKRIGRRIK